MLLNSLHFPTSGQCTLTYEKADGWLRATWTGYVNPDQAIAGARSYLAHAGPFHCLYLLNDNLGLKGPWFDSTRWLEAAWLPQAERLGLRYVAHVVQADAQQDIMTLRYPRNHISDSLELQLFHDVAEAEEWLRRCQQPPAPSAASVQKGYRSLT
jgi:hypothetical protein